MLGTYRSELLPLSSQDASNGRSGGSDADGGAPIDDDIPF
jgi:hypothetical protein